MNIEKFDRTNLEQVTREMRVALKNIEEKYGIDIKFGNVSYSSNEFGTKLSVSTKDKSYKNIKGLDIAIGKKFTSKGRDMEIVDINSKARTYPYIILDIESGKHYKVKENYFKSITFIN